ncbi:ER membrane protein complex subunit 3 [Tetrabaena socialis]|uniref:ER membrane protein complex subunit 3 n=1 Tax=Tetrabaena socialis TaxID=47790 RepID=A0A2J8AA97_9CHLO|nr:ER membrane protein complex subunit 3 [Tetrabaena socialis]|eukprot:PNH09431.1 ER membrane protein complex subunit 3 [Tetrabaena socialis]
MTGAHPLVLDAAVRDWVFIPLTLAIVLMKLITQYMHQLFNSPPPSNKELKELKEMQAVARAGRVRGYGRFIPETSFKMRKEYFAGEKGIFAQKAVTRSPQETMATDPSVMVDMMKKNLTGMVPQLGMGMVVNFFFQGFVIGKVPFPLSPRFKPMLQRGIDLASLDVSYFTSLSFYILLLFGLRGVFSLVFREDAVDESEMMRRQMNPMAANPMGVDMDAAFKAEKAALTAVDHEWELESAEERAVDLLRRQLKNNKL